ncbi:MAG: sensor histidine kinase [Oscillospiraceae bacterium]|nr:sensor histidine kinase [Oscillospiraceae bacterium]
MRTKFREIPKATRIFFIAAAVALSSQLYFNMYSEGFRISAAVIVLPVLLMTLGEDISNIQICSVTAIFVFLLRSAILFLSVGSYDNAFRLYLPNMLFYISYGIIFSWLCPNKYVVSYRKMFVVVLLSDFLSNVVEICATYTTLSSSDIVMAIISIAGIAFVRSIVSWTFLVGEKQYRTLLQHEEHEERYQRLFMMTTGLKNEIYFMKKNSEEIENVMGNAYRLHEALSNMDVSDEMKKMSLDIAKDVHEIKKDYISIIKGIEKAIIEDFDAKEMKFSDILSILEDSTQNLVQQKHMSVNLVFNYSQDFVTNEHYEIMGILKNLVTNAVEAMETAKKGNRIEISYIHSDGSCIFTVCDNGPGISPRHINNIFKMGYSTKFDPKTGNIYRGVGLYGIKTTVEEKFGGTITASSDFGSGAEFVIRIPSKSIMED